MKHLLLVAYYFPPLASGGTFRPLRLAKYLPRFGWDVTVVSVTTHLRLPKDPALLHEIPPSVRVKRAATLEARTGFLALNKLGFRRFSAWLQELVRVPDEQRGWAPFATRKALEIAASMPVDVVLTTSAPYTAHLVGRSLKSRLGVPWVADFRDEWTGNPYITYATGAHRRLNLRLEQEVLGNADRVVSVSPGCLDGLRRLAARRDGDVFEMIPNGFDDEHFEEPLPAPSSMFRIVYTGTMYGHREGTALLAGLREWLARRPGLGEKVEVVFAGHRTGEAVRDVELGCACRGLGQVSYFEAVRLLRDASVQVVVVAGPEGAGGTTGKVFNYLATGRPILALAPAGSSAADLVSSTRSGLVVPPDDPAAVAAALDVLHANWERGLGLVDQDREAVARFGMRSQAHDWVALLEGVVGSARTAGAAIPRPISGRAAPRSAGLAD